MSNSLHDGMNLVAKEFVSARDDERGVLVLSRTGAAQQFRGALLVDPYRIDDCAEALWRAMRMPKAEQATRMRLLRANVERYAADWWAHQIFSDARSVRVRAGISTGRHDVVPQRPGLESYA